MDCNQLEYKGQIYTRAEIAQLIAEDQLPIYEERAPQSRGLNSGPIKRSSKLDDEDRSNDEVDTSGINDFERMPFRFSMHKILANKKFITVRPNSFKMGTYRVGKTKLFNVFPEGKQYLKDYLAQNNMSKKDFIKEFIGQEEVMYKHIQDFLDDKIPLFIYRIDRVMSNDEIIPDINDARYARLYANRQAMIKSIKSQMAAEKDPVRHEELTARLRVLKSQSENLKSDDTRNFGMLLNMMKSDLATAKKILQTKTDRRSLDFAKSLTSNYVDILTSEFAEFINGLEGPMKEDILNFIQDAKNFAEQLNAQYNKIANEEQKKLTGVDVIDVNGVPLIVDDTNVAAGISYDSRWNKNPIVQAITYEVRSAQVKVNSEMVEFRERNNKLVKALKNIGFDFMIQTDEKGNRTGLFVSRESHAYRQARAEASQDITKQLIFYAKNHTFKINDAAWAQREAFLIDYYTNNNDVVLTQAEVDRGVTIEDKVKQYAHSLARQKNPYVMKGILDRVLANTNRITRNDKVFFSKFLEYGGLRAEKMGDTWVHPLEITAHDTWIDPKWQAIQDMPDENPRKAFYNHWMDYMEKGRRMRRDENSYLPWNYIPEKTKPLGVVSKVRQWAHDHLGQRLSKNNGVIDPETGEVEKKIPLYMLNGAISPENKSYDLGNVLEDFVKETLNYDEKSAVEEKANMLLSLLRQQKVWDTNADGSIKIISGQRQTKQGLSNNYLQVAHRIAAQLYGEYQDKEFVSDQIKLYTVEEKQRMTTIRKEMDLLPMSAAEKQEALQYTSIGADYDGTNENVTKYVELARKYQQIRDNAFRLTGSKVANSLMFLTSIKYLGLNLFAGMGEILQGFTTLYTESASGRFFNDAQATRAMGAVMAGTPGSAQRERIGQIAKIFDTVGEIFHESEGRLKSKTESWAFAQYKFANYLANTSHTVAMLMHDTIETKAGNKVSLYDAMEFKDGKISWKMDIDQPLYDEQGKPTKFTIDLVHKSDEILALNRERKTFMDPTKIDAKMVGRLLGQFKKNWMIGMFYNRFGSAKDANLTGGQSFKGFYRSFWEEITKLPTVVDPLTGETKTDTSLRALMNVPMNFLKFTLKFSTVGKKMGLLKEGEYDEVELANLKKFMREFSFAMTISTAMIVLSSMNGGDDKEPWRTYVISQLTRLQRDVQTFMSTESLTSFIKNPAPMVSSITDYVAIWDAAVKSTVMGDPYNSNGDLRIWRATEQNIPFYNQIHNLQSKFKNAVIYGKY